MTDLGLLLLRHGYHAVARDRAARGGGDTYVSRLLGSRTVVIGEPDGARAFYDESLARRTKAVPPPLAWLLFGRGALHGTDGTLHRDRKRLLLDVLDPDSLGAMVEEVADDLTSRTATWPGREVDLHDELVTVYGRAVLRWAGLDLTDGRADDVSRRLAEIVDGFGFAWPAYAGAWRSRRWSEHWARQVVADVRSGRTTPPDGSALQRIAASDLDERTAAVELLNVLRPTVAVAWLGVFSALALSRASAAERERLRDPAAVHERYAFAQEVRRTTPFVPVLTAIARRDARVSGTTVRAGDRLLLDVIGIDHHADHWPEPHQFRPDRFLDRDALTAAAAFDLVPQGGGHPSGHRCPGESLTARLLSETVRVLAGVETDLAPATIDASRMPTLPAGSGAVRVTRVESTAVA